LKLERQDFSYLPTVTIPAETEGACKIGNPEDQNTTKMSSGSAEFMKRVEQEAGKKKRDAEKEAEEKAEREEKEKAKQVARENAEREAKEKVECQERLERERMEKERIERERIERERIENERIERERIKKERIEKKRIARERTENERIERERIENERNENERIERERIDERIEEKKIARERVEKERVERERIERERIEKANIENEKKEKAERKAKEREETEKASDLAAKIPSAQGSTVGENDHSGKTSALSQKERKSEWASFLGLIPTEMEESSGLHPIAASSIPGGIFGSTSNLDSSPTRKKDLAAIPTIVGDHQPALTDAIRDQKEENQRRGAVQGLLGSNSARRRNDSAQSRMTARPTVKPPPVPPPQKQNASGWGLWGTSLLNNVANAMDEAEREAKEKAELAARENIGKEEKKKVEH
jgi:hypothetical protein